MSPCLVQQLFRQKIGKELDQGLVDEVLFPLLRSRKDLPRELLQDIKLTTDILVGHMNAGLDPPVDFNIPTFTPIPKYWTHEVGASYKSWIPGSSNPNGVGPGSDRWGRRTSKWQRKTIRPFDWGTIDILNKLRELEYPQMGYRPTYYEEDNEEDNGEGEYDDAYIRLMEDESLPPNYWSVAQRCHNRVAIEGRTRFVNNFLDDVIFKGKCLTWEGGVLGWQPCTLPLEPPFQFLCS